MTEPGRGALAAVLLATVWTLEQIAYDLPAGRCTGEQLTTIAGTLDKVAGLLRVAAHGDSE